jgi:hypothetical protein
MSLCYECEKWLVISLVMIAVSLSIGVIFSIAHSEPLTECEAEVYQFIVATNQAFDYKINATNTDVLQWLDNYCQSGMYVREDRYGHFNPYKENIDPFMKKYYPNGIPVSLVPLTSMFIDIQQRTNSSAGEDVLTK